MLQQAQSAYLIQAVAGVDCGVASGAAAGSLAIGGTPPTSAAGFSPLVACLVASAAGFGGGEGGGIMWAGGLCLSFRRTCLMRPRSVGFPGFGPLFATKVDFFSFLSLRPLGSRDGGNSLGSSSATAFQ